MNSKGKFFPQISDMPMWMGDVYPGVISNLRIRASRKKKKTDMTDMGGTKFMTHLYVEN